MFKVNELYSLREDPERIVRIIETGPESVYTVCVTDKSRCEMPKECSREIFKELYEKKSPIEVEEETEIIKTPTDYQLEKAKERWEAIGQRWNDPQKRSWFLQRRSRSRLIRQIQNELGVSYNEVKSLLTRFFREGMTLNSLMPRRKGPKQSCEQQEGKKRGKKRKDESGLSVTAEERSFFEEAYKKYYLKKGYTLETSYTLLLRDHYCCKSGEEKEFRYEDEERIPSFDQFYYWVRKNRDLETEKRARIGEKEFDNSHRIQYSSTQSQARGAGARAELDATILPIELVSSENRNVCVGRPILELLVDVYSRMIMGFSLTLENESWRSASLAIINAAEDKVRFCKEHGVEIEDREWPCRHLPSCILSDNGPFKSLNIAHFQARYPVRIEFTPPRKGSAKGNVERKNYSIATRLAEFLPGAVLKRQKGRGAFDPTDEATLSLEELTEILIREILQFNQNVITGYKGEASIVAQNLSITPCNLWEWSVDHQTDALYFVTEEKLEDLRLALLPRVKGGRVVRKDGIHLNSLKYCSKDREIQNILFNNLGKKVEVCYNPLQAGWIYIILGEKYVHLDLNDQYKSYGEMSFGEVRAYRSLERELNEEKRSSVRLKQMKTFEQREKIIKRAQKESKESPKKKDKKGNRRLEIKKNQAGEIKPEKNVSKAEAVEMKDEVPQDYLELVRDLIEEYSHGGE